MMLFLAYRRLAKLAAAKEPLPANVHPIRPAMTEPEVIAEDVSFNLRAEQAKEMEALALECEEANNAFVQAMGGEGPAAAALAAQAKAKKARKRKVPAIIDVEVKK